VPKLSALLEAGVPLVDKYKNEALMAIKSTQMSIAYGLAHTYKHVAREASEHSPMPVNEDVLPMSPEEAVNLARGIVGVV
jgi:hypothetical protein